ncbi:MAG TPA: hypothetical protein PLI31_09130 [Methanoregulaceae archaeon]|nr:hypothetical protein [Methanoregulaceae archaeon]
MRRSVTGGRDVARLRSPDAIPSVLTRSPGALRLPRERRPLHAIPAHGRHRPAARVTGAPSQVTPDRTVPPIPGEGAVRDGDDERPPHPAVRSRRWHPAVLRAPSQHTGYGGLM